MIFSTQRPKGAKEAQRCVNRLYALHGFLGRPQDWNIVEAEGAIDAVVRCDVLKIAPPSEHVGLSQWAAHFNRSLPQNKRRILMGYSLGGRLGLHALLDNPALWDGAVLISTHPGLKNMSERTKRLDDDFIWARHFEAEPWETLLTSWNSRGVFAKRPSPFIRQELHYSRDDLADMLRYWSLGHQEDLSTQIAQLPMPILWIVGEEDQAYNRHAASVSLRHPKSQVWVVPGAGHRVPWEWPEFSQKLHVILENWKVFC